MSVESEISAIEERAEACIGGPWYPKKSGEHATDVLVDHDGDTFVICEHAGADAEFIAAARTDVPKLVDAVSRVLGYLNAHEQANPLGREQWNADIREAITQAFEATA